MIFRVFRRLNLQNLSFSYCHSSSAKQNLGQSLGGECSKNLSEPEFESKNFFRKWDFLSNKFLKAGFIQKPPEFTFRKTGRQHSPKWSAEILVRFEPNTINENSIGHVLVGKSESCGQKKEAQKQAIYNLLERLQDEYGLQLNLPVKKIKNSNTGFLNDENEAQLYENKILDYIQTEENLANYDSWLKWDTFYNLLIYNGYIKPLKWSTQNNRIIRHNVPYDVWVAQLLIEFESGSKYEGHVITELTEKPCLKKGTAKEECILKMMKTLKEKYGFDIEKLKEEKEQKKKKVIPKVENKLKTSHQTILTQFFAYFKKQDKFPIIEFTEITEQMASYCWSGSIEMHWPFHFSVTSKAASKLAVRFDIYERIFDELVKARYLTKYGEIIDKIEKIKGRKKLYRQPSFIQISEEARLRLDQLMPEFQNLKLSLENIVNECNLHNTAKNTEAKEPKNETRQDDVLDIITGIPLSKIQKSESYMNNRSKELLQRWKNLNIDNSSPKLQKLLETRKNLPIFQKREEILDIIDKNQVTLIRGETGCGKTTQLPQYIFENFVENNKGSYCNVVVTQPRRISAISVAERIAVERWERIGDTVGFRIRLKQVKPRGNGSIFFTTPGMLLRSRLGNLDFQGVSHVIVDEVHERDIWTDFLLISLKRALKTNPNLKLILMSATFGVEKFQKYFENCPVVEVSGRAFPVQEYFLEDVNKFLNRSNHNSAIFGLNLRAQDSPNENKTENNSSGDQEPIENEIGADSHVTFGQRIPTDVDTVIDIIRYIHKNQGPGAILCFLPTTSDIKSVLQSAQKYDLSDVMFLPCHSRLPVHQQKNVFEKPPEGVRKIILATNIAETSITINDVKYVVNTGTSKSEIFDHEAKSLRTVEFWTSRASQTQRKGRAGRVSEGHCYHLFPRHYWDSFPQNSSPELLKKELNTVILLAKLFSPNEDPADFLSEAIDQPLPNQVETAVQELIDMKFLDENRNLTPMGQKLAHFGCSPKLAKAMLYSILLKCTDPVLTISAMLEINQDIFDNSSDIDRSKINEVKHSALGSTYSDHVTYANLYNAYKEAKNGPLESIENAEDNFKQFFEENLLNPASFALASDLRGIFANNLVASGLAENVDDLFSTNSESNKFCTIENFIKSALAAGLHQNLFKLCPDKNIQNWRLKMGMIDSQRRKGFQTRSGGVLDKLAKDGIESSSAFWLICHDKVLNIDGSTFRVEDLSLVDPKTCVLFSGFKLKPYGSANIILSPSSDFKMAFEITDDVDRVLFLRRCFDQLADWYCLGVHKKLKNDLANCQIQILGAQNLENSAKIVETLAENDGNLIKNTENSKSSDGQSRDSSGTVPKTLTSDQFNDFHNRLLDTLACLFTNDNNDEPNNQ